MWVNGGFLHENEKLRLEFFAVEEWCWEFLRRLPTPYGDNYCPECHKWMRTRALPPHMRWSCTKCKAKRSLQAETHFAATKIPLPLWFLAVWIYAEGLTRGARLSARALHEQLNNTVHFRTAQRMLKVLKTTVCPKVEWRGFSFHISREHEIHVQNGLLIVHKRHYYGKTYLYHTRRYGVDGMDDAEMDRRMKAISDAERYQSQSGRSEGV